MHTKRGERRWKKERAKELFDRIFNSSRDVIIKKI